MVRQCARHDVGAAFRGGTRAALLREACEDDTCRACTRLRFVFFFDRNNRSDPESRHTIADPINHGSRRCCSPCAGTRVA